MNFVIYLSLSIISKILASAREFGVGYFWGAGSIVDGFIIAMMLPMFFVDVANVLFNSTYISIYVKNESAQRRQFFFDASVFLCALIIISDVIIHFFLNYYILYSNLPEKTVAVVNDISPYVIVYYSLMVVCEFFKAHLMANERQKIMPVPMILSNIIFITAMYFVAGKAGNIALVLCFMVSAIVQVMMYFPLISNKKVDINPLSSKYSRKENIRDFLHNIPPVLFNAAVNQSSKITDKLIASGLIIGSLSTIYFSQQLYALYVNVIIVSVLAFAYPKMCKKTLNHDEFSQYVINVTMLLLILIMFPLSLGWGLSGMIFKLVLSKMSPENVALATNMFMVLSLALIFESISATLKRAYWAVGKMKVTVYISALTVFLNIIFSIGLSHYFGVKGLIYAYCLSTLISCVILMVAFFKEYSSNIDYSNAPLFMSILSISCVTYLLLKYVKPELTNNTSIIYSMLIVLLGGGVFIASIYKSKIIKVLTA